MKHKIFLLVFLFSAITFAQDKYYTKSGTITFESSVPSFEEVKAVNNKVTTLLNAENGDFAVLILVKAFRFKIALMEEHFNENYAESNKFPKATFSGKIRNYDKRILSRSHRVWIEGRFTFHGVTKKVNIPVSITNEDDIINMEANFSLKPEDYNIKIPKIVRNKIAEKVGVRVKFKLKKK